MICKFAVQHRLCPLSLICLGVYVGWNNVSYSCPYLPFTLLFLHLSTIVRAVNCIGKPTQDRYSVLSRSAFAFLLSLDPALFPGLVEILSLSLSLTLSNPICRSLFLKLPFLICSPVIVVRISFSILKWSLRCFFLSWKYCRNSSVLSFLIF